MSEHEWSLTFPKEQLTKESDFRESGIFEKLNPDWNSDKTSPKIPKANNNFLESLEGATIQFFPLRIE